MIDVRTKNGKFRWADTTGKTQVQGVLIPRIKLAADPALYDPAILVLAGITPISPRPAGKRGSLTADPFVFFSLTRPRPLPRMHAKTRAHARRVESWIALYRQGTPVEEIFAHSTLCRHKFHAALRWYANTDFTAMWAARQRLYRRRAKKRFYIRDDIPRERAYGTVLFHRAEAMIRLMETMPFIRAAEQLGLDKRVAMTALKLYMKYRPRIRRRKESSKPVTLAEAMGKSC